MPIYLHHENTMCIVFVYYVSFKGAVGSADLKISKSALLFLNHHNFSNTKPIYTEKSFMESLLNHLAPEIKTKMVDLLPWQQQTLIRRPRTQ